MTILRFSFYFMIVYAFLLIPTCIHSQKHNVALFIFGDSIFDTGNNNYLKTAAFKANVSPYGESFFEYPTGRFSDGRVIPDFIAMYLKLPFIQPYLQPGNNFIDGVNFASAGSGALVETFPGQTIDLKTQLSHFKNVEEQLRLKLGDTQANALLSRAINLFSVGSNDYGFAFLTNSTLLYNYSRDEFVGMVIGNLTSVIKEIYKSGGRKFGFLSLGALGFFPTLRALSPAISGEQVTFLVKKHNMELSKLLNKLQRQLKGFKYSYFDYYTSSIDRINNPSMYGFKEVKAACCGSGPYRGILNCGGMMGFGGGKEYELCENPCEHLFFDGVHPTEAFDCQIAELMWSGSHELARPYNLKMLVEA